MQIMRILNNWPSDTLLAEYLESLDDRTLRCGWHACVMYAIVSDDCSTPEINEGLKTVASRLCGVTWTDTVEGLMTEQTRPRSTPQPAPPVNATALSPKPDPKGFIVSKTSPPPPKGRAPDPLTSRIVGLAVGEHIVIGKERFTKKQTLQVRVSAAKKAGGHEGLYCYEAHDGTLVVAIDPNRKPRKRKGSG